MPITSSDAQPVGCVALPPAAVAAINIVAITASPLELAVNAVVDIAAGEAEGLQLGGSGRL
jgi:hypothetical protein